MDIKKYLKLSFMTNDSKALSINISNPRNNLTNSEINDAMNTIINSDIILYKSGKPSSKKSAEVIETTSSPFVIS